MRLMMAKKLTTITAKYGLLFSFLPLSVLALLFFSFRPAEPLPEQGPAKAYKLKWGEIECMCRNEQFPNLYHCDNQSMMPRELRRLIRRSGGFQLLLEDQPQEIRELTAVSKYTKDMGGFQGQFDEMGQAFNTESPLWKAADKGDVFRFTFNNGNGDHFEFDVVVNTRKEEFIYGSRVEMGDFQYSIDLTNEASVVHVELEELKRMAQHPLKIRKNNTTYFQLAGGTITNSGALRRDEWEKNRGETLDISQAPSIREAFPGDRIHVKLVSSEDEKINFTLLVRSSSAWNGEQRDFRVQWGDRFFDNSNVMILTEPEFKKLLDKPMYLLVRGERHLMKDREMKTGGMMMVNGNMEETPKKVFGLRDYLEKMKISLTPGKLLRLNGLKEADEFQSPPLMVLIDLDWKAVFPERAVLTVSERGSVMSISNPQPQDLARILDQENFNPKKFHFQIDDETFNGSQRSPEAIRQLVEQGKPQEKLTITLLHPFSGLKYKMEKAGQ